jgi:very-short-patch-repair endonuclease
MKGESMPRAAKPKSPAAVRARARQLRRPLTRAEQVRQHLRNRNFGGKFRRQRPIGPFIVDFYCNEARLVVELDGESHNHAAQAEHDEVRTEWLQDRGYRVLRFWNQDVLRDTDSVIVTIVEALSLSSPSPAERERG